jgi:hypothetical protein
VLKVGDITISLDGLTRALDNIRVEFLWHGVKHEDAFSKDYATPDLLDAKINCGSMNSIITPEKSLDLERHLRYSSKWKYTIPNIKYAALYMYKRYSRTHKLANILPRCKNTVIPN